MTDENDSFIQSKAGYELFGEPLRPYSASRKVAANSMGVLYPMIGEEGAAQFQKTNSYPGILKDCLCVLWLCSLPDAHEVTADQVKAGQFTPSRALSKPQEAFDAAMAWADPKGLCDMGSEAFSVAVQTFVAIVTGVEAAKFQIVTGEHSEDEPGKV